MKMKMGALGALSPQFLPHYANRLRLNPDGENHKHEASAGARAFVRMSSLRYGEEIERQMPKETRRVYPPSEITRLGDNPLSTRLPLE